MIRGDSEMIFTQSNPSVCISGLRISLVALVISSALVYIYGLQKGCSSSKACCLLRDNLSSRMDIVESGSCGGWIVDSCNYNITFLPTIPLLCIFFLLFGSMGSHRTSVLSFFNWYTIIVRTTRHALDGSDGVRICMPLLAFLTG